MLKSKPLKQSATSVKNSCGRFETCRQVKVKLSCHLLPKHGARPDSHSRSLPRCSEFQSVRFKAGNKAASNLAAQRVLYWRSHAQTRRLCWRCLAISAALKNDAEPAPRRTPARRSATDPGGLRTRTDLCLGEAECLLSRIRCAIKTHDSRQVFRAATPEPGAEPGPRAAQFGSALELPKFHPLGVASATGMAAAMSSSIYDSRVSRLACEQFNTKESLA